MIKSNMLLLNTHAQQFGGGGGAGANGKCIVVNPYLPVFLKCLLLELFIFNTGSRDIKMKTEVNYLEVIRCAD